MNELMKFISTSIGAFFILQLINVMLSTVKSILTIRGKFWVAALINGIYFGFYTFIIKGIGDANFTTFCGIPITMSSVLIIAIITVVTNFIGVYTSLKILDKLRKDDLWLIKITIKPEHYKSLINDLFNEKLHFVRIMTDWVDLKVIEVYSYSREESKKTIKLLKQYPGTKYCRITARMDLYE